MRFKYTIIAGLFLFFALLQNSFFAYAGAGKLNIIFILFFILIFFEQRSGFTTGIFATVLAGFFLDILSWPYFGVSMAILFLVYMGNKWAMHFLNEGKSSYLILHFIISFMVSFTTYVVLVYAASMVLHFEYMITWGVLAGMMCNLVIVCAGFFIYKKLNAKEFDNQLKLF